MSPQSAQRALGALGAMVCAGGGLLAVGYTIPESSSD